MARAVDFSILGVLALVGAGTGLQLGWSAIGEINPVYFSEAPSGSRFHSDLAPNRSFDSGAPMPQAEMADELALGSGCVGCRTFPVDYRPVQDPAIEEAFAPSRPKQAEAPVQLASFEEEAPEETARRKAALERVELYSRAPVTVEEAAIAPAAAEEVQTTD